MPAGFFRVDAAATFETKAALQGYGNMAVRLPYSE
jgi:hypothetical protein